MMVRWSLVAVLMLGPVTMAEQPAGEQPGEAEDVTPRIYRTLDDKGRPVFTDVPDPSRNSEEVQVREQNTINMVKPKPLIMSGQKPEKSPLQYRLAITSPADQTTIRHPQSLTIKYSAQPALQEGHRLRLLDNGVETTATIAWPDRGEHRLVVQVIDAEGEVISESEPVVVYIHRPTIKN